MLGKGSFGKVYYTITILVFLCYTSIGGVVGSCLVCDFVPSLYFSLPAILIAKISVEPWLVKEHVVTFTQIFEMKEECIWCVICMWNDFIFRSLGL